MADSFCTKLVVFVLDDPFLKGLCRFVHLPAIDYAGTARDRLCGVLTGEQMQKRGLTP